MKAQKRPRKTPTFKQKLFAKKYIEHKGNGTKAALEVYDADYETAKSIATKNLHKEIVQQEIGKVLDNAGLNLDYLAEKSKDIIEAIDKQWIKQATAVNHLQFLYKVHNVLPANKSMSMRVSLKDQLTSKDLSEVKDKLSELVASNQALLEEFGKK